jgi:hypothetical protein
MSTSSTMKWRRHPNKNPDSELDRYYYTASTPVGTFYVMAYGAKWGASLLPFDKHQGAGDIDIGKLRVNLETSQKDAERFYRGLYMKMKEFG